MQYIPLKLSAWPYIVDLYLDVPNEYLRSEPTILPCPQCNGPRPDWKVWTWKTHLRTENRSIYVENRNVYVTVDYFEQDFCSPECVALFLLRFGKRRSNGTLSD